MTCIRVSELYQDQSLEEDPRLSRAYQVQPSKSLVLSEVYQAQPSKSLVFNEAYQAQPSKSLVLSEVYVDQASKSHGLSETYQRDPQERAQGLVKCNRLILQGAYLAQ